MRRGPALAVLLAATLPVCVAGAQDVSKDSTTRRTPASSRGRLAVTGCAGQPISDIVVLAQPPYSDRLPARFDFLRRFARAMHATTRDEIVHRYLLMHPGEPCNQIRRAESERILRAQPFLADARIRVYDDERGGVRLEVETRDEFSAIIEPTVHGSSPLLRGLRLGDGNVNGYGRLAAVEWREGLAYHDALGMQYTDYQFGGDRNEFRALAMQTLRGQELRAEIVRPYYTDLQRFAFIGSVGGQRDYAPFRRPTGLGNAVEVASTDAVIGGIARIGSVRRLKLAGLTFTQATERVNGTPVIIGSEGFEPDTGLPLVANFRRKNVARINALFGVRMLRFVPVEGFDALTGTQDIRVGMQLATTYGHSIDLGTSHDRDRFMAASLYAGIGGPKSFIGTQISGEARNDRVTGSWDNHIVSGRLAWYFRPAVHQLTLLSSEWSAGRDMRTPFQLSLADHRGGLFGHHGSFDAGAKRLVVRGEQRLVIPSRLNVADAGVAWFAEAGRLWGEESVPYSATTPWRGAVGVSLLAAVPPRSRRLWRLDFAMPVGNDRHNGFEVRFSNEDRTRVFWTEPRDVQSARERTTPRSLFTWP